jgi:hypothetical protein
MTHEEMKNFLYKIERQFAPEVDATVRRFAETGRWPNGAWNHGYFLARRIEYAMEVLSAMDMHIYADPRTMVWHEPVPAPQAFPETIVK